MKCWKCGQELTDGTSVCIYCGVAQSRPAPATEAGRVMRLLYNRYGAQAVLTNGAYLTNGLGDVMEDSKKLRNQLRMAIDAGVGRLYLEQLSYGAPNDDFDRRVKDMLTEDAGLSSNAAAELAGYFDEMIGWRMDSYFRAPTHTPSLDVGEKILGLDAINRGKCDTTPGSEIERGAPEGAKQEKTFVRNKFYPYEWAALASVAAGTINCFRAPHFGSMDLFNLMFILQLLSLLTSFTVKRENLKRSGSTIESYVSLYLPALVAFFAAMYIVVMTRSVGGRMDIGSLMEAVHSGEGQMVAKVLVSALLFLQMIRHRVLEGRLLKT